jgi:hypothetical protein
MSENSSQPDGQTSPHPDGQSATPAASPGSENAATAGAASPMPLSAGAAASALPGAALVEPDPPLDVLAGLSVTMRESLKRAGIVTVGQLEAELGNEAALCQKVSGVGAKRVLQLRQEVESYRKNLDSAPVPPAAAGPSAPDASPMQQGPANPVPAPKSRAKRLGGNREETRANNRTVRIILVLLAVIFGAGLLGQWVFGRSLAPEHFPILHMLLSVFAAVIIFLLFPSTTAGAGGAAQGTAGQTKYSAWFRLGGSAALSLLLYLALYLSTVFLGHKTVQVYFPRGAADMASSASISERIEVFYRRPYGQGVATGQDWHVVVQDLPLGSSNLVVNGVKCFGYITVKEREGEPPPWEYPIINGEVDIPLIKVAPTADPMPTAEQVRAMVKDQGIAEDEIIKPGRFSKSQVALTIENATDRTITFVAFDCVAAYRSATAVQCKDSRDIAKGAHITWGNFNQWKEPSGWFALFVRYADRETNRVVQRPLGVFNLFLIREPRVVIERSDAPGVEFQVDKSRSKLGG